MKSRTIRTNMKTRRTRSEKRIKTRKSRKFSKTRKTDKTNKNYVYTKEDFASGDGMITNIWGPPFWLVLHTMSFNYPTQPTAEDKKNYMNFVFNLQNVLPCKYCRMNLAKNLKQLPLTLERMESRETFSRYMYELHEIVNKMLGKKSGLTYDDVRERFENFRSRCASKMPKIITHKGCVIPLIGLKKKCVLKIVPYNEKCDTLTIDKKCLHAK